MSSPGSPSVTAPQQLLLLEIDSQERREWEEDREKLMSPKIAVNTRSAYRSGWRAFTEWCRVNKYEPLPASFDAVSFFVRHLVNEEQLRLSSVRVKVAAVQHFHRVARQPDPVDARVRAMLSGARRERKERDQHKAAVTADQVLAVLAANAGDRPKAVRDRALFLVLFATGWRRSELRALNLTDVTFQREGMVLSLGATKGDQDGQGRDVSVPYDDEEPANCPVRHLEQWMKVRGPQRGPLFCPVRKGGQISLGQRLTGHSICHRVQDMLKRAGVKDPKRYGAHSLRSGMITAAHLNGANEKDIMHSTGHRSILTMWRYIRPLAGFKRFPLRGVLAKAKTRKATA